MKPPGDKLDRITKAIRAKLRQIGYQLHAGDDSDITDFCISAAAFSSSKGFCIKAPGRLMNPASHAMIDTDDVRPRPEINAGFLSRTAFQIR